jgi:hypothetical protein
MEINVESLKDFGTLMQSTIFTLVARKNNEEGEYFMLLKGVWLQVRKTNSSILFYKTYF